MSAKEAGKGKDCGENRKTTSRKCRLVKSVEH